MTNGEAIEILKGAIKKPNTKDGYLGQALDIAIKALEQQPCEDAVSREVEAAKLQQAYNKGVEDRKQAVLDIISELNAISFYEAQEDSKECYYEIRQAVENMQPVTPQQKIGRWIEHPEIETSTPGYLMFYECSECWDKQCFCKSDIHKKRFCSNCGARMVEPQESEDKE